MERVLAQRVFSMADSRDFAALSGDWNPLHVDAIAARRTMFGAPLVHGVHQLLWALDHVLDAGAGPRLAEIRAAFRRPVLLDQEIFLVADAERATRFTARSASETVLELDVAFADPIGAVPAPPAGSWPLREAALDVEREAMAAQAGALPLVLERALADTMFPRLTANLPAATVAEILATTRLVGMRCPGLHSLFAALHLKRTDEASRQTGELTFLVRRANLKFSSVVLAVRGPTLEGTLDTFARPAPRASLAMTDVQARVSPGEFEGRRALVIGGTRGIGESFAKAIAAGGGRVVITYHRGSAEAERVCSEIAGVCGSESVRAMVFDATAPASLATAWPAPWRPSHLYYLATPFIRVDRSKPFDTAEFDVFSRYYVTGLYRTIEACRALSEDLRSVWAPSTVFLDAPEAGTAAYAAAKAAMEELGRQLNAALPLRVATPRLPRIQTDQTASLGPGAAADPLTVTLAELRKESA